MRKIKVLHVSTTTAGGLGQSILSLVTSLDPQTFEVSVAFGPGYPLDKAFVESGLRVFPVRLRRGLKLINVAGLWDLVRLLRKERFDIVHAHSSEAGVLGRLAAKITGVPVVFFTLHGYASLNYDSVFSRSLLWMVEKLMDACTHHYVAVSRYVEKIWLDRGIVSRDRVSVIHNGVDPDAVPRPSDPAAARRRIGLPVGVPVVGTAALLEPRKGMEYLLRAVPAVLESFPACRFVIMGDGPLRPELEEVTRQLGIGGAVHFLGWRNDAAELIGVLDIFCLPSLQEGFSVVLLEAMAHARPIVATRVSGTPEGVVDGDTGLLVPPMDSPALIKAITYFLANPDTASQMGHRGKTRLIEHFTLDKMRRQFEGLYLRAYRERCDEIG